MNTRVLEGFLGHVFCVKRSYVELILMKWQLWFFRLCLKPFTLLSVMCDLLHFVVEKLMLSKKSNSYWSSSKKRKNATDFIISIIMTGHFGALEQRHCKFLPCCNIDMVSDYWDFQNRPETQKKSLTSVWLKVRGVISPMVGGVGIVKR